MSVLSLHELCRRELRALLGARYMPRGWSKEGDRKAAVRFNEVHTLLEACLGTVPDHLLSSPDRVTLQPRLLSAAAEHTLKDMVDKYVEELTRLPVPDQADAYAAAELRSRLAYLDRVRRELTHSRQKLGETVGESGVRGVDFEGLFEQLDAAVATTEHEYNSAETTLASYEAVL